jgi:2-keto-4-pentenoate hydratase/2-oxohepta-3-ene-1,7-dioic acid hydratase in catechol pathway
MTTSTSGQTKITRYVRYAAGGAVSYGILDGMAVKELRGDIFKVAEQTGRTLDLREVKLLAPCTPSKVLAIGINYKTHLGDRAAPASPRVFLKLPTSIVGPEDPIVFPEGAGNVHFEGEMVAVIGKEAKKISKTEAADFVFGVTAGNDVSERDWQKGDSQWYRAKASDTFGPIGPSIVQGLNYNDLLLQSRLNGEVKQSQRTSDMMFDVATQVSYISQFITLFPGDIIFTGTPGQTQAMKRGDVIEVEVEGVGILRNSIA